eukprot:3025587-Pleurochrysis_carterae.AAC.1
MALYSFCSACVVKDRRVRICLVEAAIWGGRLCSLAWQQKRGREACPVRCFGGSPVPRSRLTLHESWRA